MKICTNEIFFIQWSIYVMFCVFFQDLRCSVCCVTSRKCPVQKGTSWKFKILCKCHCSQSSPRHRNCGMPCFPMTFPPKEMNIFFFQEKIFTIYKVLNSVRLFKGTKQMRCVFWTSLKTFTHTLYSFLLAKLYHKKSCQWLFWLSKTLQKLWEKTIIF